ncbi:acyl-CoA reductase [Proteus genomosp. 4]|uniref:acyl-CoA reductase n=1 Tax=Proteus genomosp. 4 TaxID=1311818 RepID=UPI000D69FE88|nr:acyl-CoA reductase [Proteus genomosp. 4]
MIEAILVRLANIKLCLIHCLNENWLFSDDVLTQKFCLERLKQWAYSDVLAQKVANELGNKNWRAPNKLLIVVSEKDPLGTLEALLAGYLIGSPIRIKARLSTQWLYPLRTYLGLNENQCEILNWSSENQNDELVLEGIEAILLAGGDALIQHYRQITPAHIKLIELGPKISGMAILGDSLPDISLVLNDVCLFRQQVCSSPRFILLENKTCAEQLYQQLSIALPSLSPLPDDLKLQQMAQAHEYSLSRERLNNEKPTHYDAKSGWAVTYHTQFRPQYWLNFGFQLIVGSVDHHLQLAQKEWFARLQTLAYHGDLSSLSLQNYCFTRYCPIGTMHSRPMTATHDGFFILAALVFFVNKEG